MKLEPLISWWWIGLYLLVVLPAIGWQFWQIFRRKHRRTALKRWLPRAAILVLPAFIAVGPSVPGGVSSPGVANLDVIFAVDTTPSIGALDYAGSKQRLDGVKQDLQTLAGKLRGAQLEVITFDSLARVILPPTNDATAFATATQGLTPQISSYSQGSNINEPIKLITEELKSSKSAHSEHYRLLFYFGDGEQTANEPAKSFASLKEYLNGGAVLGYGTTKGAKIPKYTSSDSTTQPSEYITTVDAATKKAVPAISRMSPETLKKMATELALTYQDRNRGGSMNNLDQSSRTKLLVDHSQRVVHYFNLYWLVAIPFAGLIFWEWLQLAMKLFDLRKHRKGDYA